MDLRNDDNVASIVKDAFSNEQDNYRREIDKQWRILRGDLDYFIEEYIKDTFSKTSSMFTRSNINMASQVSKKRARAYQHMPVRVLRNEKETQAYTEALKDAKSKWALREFDLYANHLNAAALWFNYLDVEGEQKAVLRALRPSQYFRKVNSLGETEVFGIYLGESHSSSNPVRGDHRKLIIQDEPEDFKSQDVALWTKDQHIVISVSGSKDGRVFQRKSIADNEEGINPLGMIPATFVQEGSAQYRPPFNTLSDQTITLNFILTVIVTAMASQAVGQLVIKHPEGQSVPDVLQQGMFTFIKLAQETADGVSAETTAEYISPSPDLANMIEVFSLYASRVLAEHGVRGGESITGDPKQFASGVDRLLSQMDTTEIIIGNQEKYITTEEDLYKLFQAFYKGTGKYSFMTDMPNVVFQKPKPHASEKEILEIAKMKKDLGIIEKYEILMALDPNLSEGDAKAKIDAIEESSPMNLLVRGMDADNEEGSNEDSELERNRADV